MAYVFACKQDTVRSGNETINFYTRLHLPRYNRRFRIFHKAVLPAVPLSCSAPRKINSNFQPRIVHGPVLCRLSENIGRRLGCSNAVDVTTCFSTLKAVKLHISSSVKTRTNSAMGSRALRPAGPGGAKSEARRDPLAAAEPDSKSELKYFHKGLHRLRGPGPGFPSQIVILSFATGSQDSDSRVRVRPGRRGRRRGWDRPGLRVRAAGAPGWWNSNLVRNVRHSPSAIRRRLIR